jgi:hypothetical protein
LKSFNINTALNISEETRRQETEERGEGGGEEETGDGEREGREECKG